MRHTRPSPRAQRNDGHGGLALFAEPCSQELAAELSVEGKQDGARQRAVGRLGSVHVFGRPIAMRITGTVKFFDPSKGFGFIQPEDGSKDVFVHATALERAGIRTLNEGDKVSFELEDDRRGRGKQAGRVQLA
jgi:CspA family cold shock protein